MEYTPRSLEEIGERIFLSERFYNCANGFSAAQDRLPERFHTEAGSGGEGIDIPPVDRLRLNEELQKYYRIRGLTADGTFADDGFLESLP
jgi:aldehyde:ferredoxin oxidoreductase